MEEKEEKLLTLDDVKRNLPSRKGSVTQEVVDMINASRHEPEFQGETLLQTAITYESVLQKNKASIKDYLKAIKFCAYLISMDDNFTEAYKRTFAERKFVQDRLDEPTNSTRYNELTSAASRYRKSKLVVDILTMSQVPLDLMFTGARYKALGVLSELMVTAKYDRDKINAAKELLAATKGPDNVKIDLDVGVKESSAVEQLNDQLMQIAARQKTMLETGTQDLKELGSMKVKEEVIDAEVE